MVLFRLCYRLRRRASAGPSCGACRFFHRIVSRCIRGLRFGHRQGGGRRCFCCTCDLIRGRRAAAAGRRLFCDKCDVYDVGSPQPPPGGGLHPRTARKQARPLGCGHASGGNRPCKSRAGRRLPSAEGLSRIGTGPSGPCGPQPGGGGGPQLRAVVRGLRRLRPEPEYTPDRTLLAFGARRTQRAAGSAANIGNRLFPPSSRSRRDRRAAASARRRPAARVPKVRFERALRRLRPPLCVQYATK